ncbi:LPXTG cell wall anchor domain-containing protein [Kitasatospora sp. NBC_01246]|uniref:LPXTG cell wall anchor domain-containing protein n=1 Tax=Kitasatospora sp. NBC_01246 TaxID=2903570 RepID=UPI002E335E3C|nr:LPXTG cell wall anchor domain-containing protein [Kitasatospora sp. NBC_01246]
MSIRRSFALAGAAALASSMVLAGAQGAVAVGTTGSPSATAAPQADKSSRQSLDLSVRGVPDTFIAGGDAREFTFRIDNSTRHDFVFYPLLKFKNRAGSLEAGDLKVEYQLPGGAWLPGSVAPGGGDSDDDAVLILLGGADSDDAMLAVNRGKDVSIKVRASFTKDAPLGKAGVVPVVFSEQLDDQSHEPVGNGHFSCDGITGAGFTIKAGGGKPSPTASQTTGKPTGSPSPSHSPSQSPSHSPSHSPSATATATPTTTATATPTATATATPTATATATPTATPTATTSASTSPSASASPSSSTSAQPTGATTSAPSTGGTGAQEPIDFPVTVPTVTPPKLTPAAVAKAKNAADNADKALAQTGGGDDTTGIAIAGGAVLAVGAGTLVLLRRRKAAQQG